MPTIFTKIINREIPAYIVKEDDQFIAFLNINPVNPGHTLVVPKLEIDKIYDHEDEVLSKMLIFAKPLCKALEKTTDCLRAGLLTYGLDVHHAHLHIMPIHGNPGDMNLSNAAPAKQEDLLEMKERLIEAQKV